MIDLKELSQARLLGRCLAGILAINLLIVGLAFWTGTGAASGETDAAAPLTPLGPIASAPHVTPKPNRPTTVQKIDPPAPIQAKSANPPKAFAPKIAREPSPSMPAKITEKTVRSHEPTKLQSPSEAPVRVEEFKPAVLRLANPSETGGVVYYAVDGETFSLSPGECHELASAAECLVEFHRGGDFGYATFKLRAGDYLFVVGETGWSLAPGKISPALSRAN